MGFRSRLVKGKIRVPVAVQNELELKNNQVLEVEISPIEEKAEE
jgi:hypothetical protein